MDKSALISHDGRYRYALERRWNKENPKRCLFVMLNPSIADADIDDPTIRRCIGFAKKFDCGGLTVVNMFAFRATNPAELGKSPNPVGYNNNFILALEVMKPTNGLIIAAWGSGSKCPADLFRRQEWLTKRFLRKNCPTEKDIYCLGKTAKGHPKHPLYLSNDQSTEIFLGAQPQWKAR